MATDMHRVIRAFRVDIIDAYMLYIYIHIYMYIYIYIYIEREREMTVLFYK